MHERTPPTRRQFTRSAMAFGIMAATTLTAAYFIQLRFVQPAVLNGELDGLAPWTQYNPHGVFIALEEVGYPLMGAAFLFAGLVLSTENRLVRAVRIVFLVGFASVTTAFVALSVVSGFDVEYRFEVAAITIDGTVLIVAGALLAMHTGGGAELCRRNHTKCYENLRVSVSGRSHPASIASALRDAPNQCVFRSGRIVMGAHRRRAGQ